jgi:hypothetical protein
LQVVRETIQVGAAGNWSGHFTCWT